MYLANKKYYQDYYKKNSEEIKRKERIYKGKNFKRLKQYSIDYYKKNSGKVKKYQEKYRKANKIKISLRDKKYYKKNSDRIKKKVRDYNNKNKERISKRSAKYRSRPEVKLMKKTNDRIYIQRNMKKISLQMSNRKKVDGSFRIKCILRSKLHGVLKKYTKTGKIWSSKEYGIDYGAIINHLKPFPEDTSKYHIDHIKPLCSFNFVNEDGSTNLEEVKQAFAPKNHQWLLAEDNFKKRKYDGSQKIATINYMKTIKKKKLLKENGN